MNNKLSTFYKLAILTLISGQALAGSFFGPEPTPAPVITINPSTTAIISPSVEQTAGSNLVGYNPSVSLNGQYVYYVVFPGDTAFNDIATTVGGAYLYNRVTGERTQVILPAEVADGTISTTVIGVSDDGTKLYTRTQASPSPGDTMRTESYTIATQARKVLTTLPTGEGIRPHDSIQIRANAASQRFHPTQPLLAYVSIYDSVDLNGDLADADGNLNLYVKNIAQDQVIIQREIPVSSVDAQYFNAARISSDLSYLAIQAEDSDSILTMNIETGATTTVNMGGLHPSDQSTRVMQISNDGQLLGVNVYHTEASQIKFISDYTIFVNTLDSSIEQTITGSDIGVPDHAITLVPTGGDFPNILRYWTVDAQGAINLVGGGMSQPVFHWPRSTMVVENEGSRETQQLLYDFFESALMDMQNQLSADGSVYVFPSSSNELVEGDTNEVFAIFGQAQILTADAELEILSETSMRVIGENVYLNGVNVPVGTVWDETNFDLATLASGAITILRNGKDVFIRQMGSAGTNLVVAPESLLINTATTASTNIGLQLNAQDLFAIEVECTASNDNITLSSRTTGSVFPAAPQSLLIDTTNLNTNTFALATSLSTYVDNNGAFVSAPEPITASGVYASLTYNVQPVSGTTDVTCTAMGSDADGLPQTISVTNATITLDNGINDPLGNGQIVSGTVIVPLGVDPASIVVTLTINDVSITTTVDANGVFTFDNIRMDDVVISVDAPNAVAECTAATVGSEAVSAGDITVYRGDINKDGVIDIADFTFLSSRFGLSEGENRYRAKADLNKDGIINIQDLAILGSALGIAACAPASS